MAFSATDLEKLLKLIAFGQAAFVEAANIINNHRAQSGKTEQEILADAQKKNDEAKRMIEAL